MKKMLPICIFIIFILLWEISTSAFKIPSYILPLPSSIAKEFFLKPAYLFSNFLITFFETVTGFFIGSFCAFILSILFSQVKILKDAFMPYLVSLKVIPTIIIAPLIIIWFGHSFSSKIIITALACFLPVLVNMIKGLSLASQVHIDLFRSLGA